MADPQGTASFPGLQTIIKADITFSHGISPSVCSVQTVPQARLIAEIGNLVFRFGNRTLTFPNCAIASGSLRTERATTWSLSILDRRWKWKYGVISGAYNARHPNDRIVAGTGKTPRELAELCLKAMNERGFDVSKLPNRTRPEVNWFAINPAIALDQLCADLGCRVVLGLNNRVTLWPEGKGAALPQNDSVTSLSFTLTGRIQPDSLRVVVAPVRFQSKFLLEAVGEDTDGQIKLLDDLSYKPDGGWGPEYPGEMYGVTGTYVLDGKDVEKRTLAIKSVYRMYRIKEQAQGGFIPPGYDGNDITTIDQYTFSRHRAETAKDADGIERRLPAQVSGTFWLGAPHNDAEVVGNSSEHSHYPGGFSVDAERRLVLFSEPVTKLVGDATMIEATLYLTTSYTIIDKNRLPVRFQVDRNLQANNGTGPELLRHEEIQPLIIQRYDGIRLAQKINNAAEVRAESNHILDERAAQFEQRPAGHLNYAGLIKVELDGAIQQARFSVGAAGCFTSISLNQEFDIYTPTYEERRRQERLDALLAERPDLEVRNGHIIANGQDLGVFG